MSLVSIHSSYEAYYNLLVRKLGLAIPASLPARKGRAFVADLLSKALALESDPLYPLALAVEHDDTRHTDMAAQEPPQMAWKEKPSMASCSAAGFGLSLNPTKGNKKNCCHCDA